LFLRFLLFGAERLSAPEPASRLRIAATLLRIVFICLLIAVTMRVAMPQNETIWTAYDTPADLVRLILGIFVSIFLAAQLLYGPKDAHAYRTWLYLGLAGVPVVLMLLFVVW
jgi:TRAP-type C4-dicarboxylate transport system permease small subunit